MNTHHQGLGNSVQRAPRTSKVALAVTVSAAVAAFAASAPARADYVQNGTSTETSAGCVGNIAISGSSTYPAAATGCDNVAIGTAAVANSGSSTGAYSETVAIGRMAAATGTFATAVGGNAVATGDQATAIGTASSAVGTQATAVGNGAIANGATASAFGQGAFAVDQSIAVGQNASATATFSTAVGKGSIAAGGTALGFQANAGAADAVALGVDSSASATGSVAIARATASAVNAVAIGEGANAADANSVALGANATTRAYTTVNSVALNGVTYSGFAGTPVGVVSVGSAGAERQIVNVAAGAISATSTDAVNGSQLFSIANQVSTLTADLANLTTTVGKISSSVPGGTVTNPTDTAIGTNTSVTATNGTAVGNGSNVSGDNGTAVGVNATVTATNGTAIGTNSKVTAANGTAIGTGSNVSGTDSTAIGTNSRATANNAVALGANSVADRDNTVSIGSPGAERQLTNVADGTAPTDGVNVRQLNGAINSVREEMSKYRKDANAGTASAIAMANLPQAVLPGEKVVALGGGTYGGQSAMAVGLSVATAKWLVKGSVTTAVSGHGSFGAGAGVGYRW
ncbi:adhesin [Burkholderia anthina]|uniref:YadA family autotransporter adhesin n=1 Tax=Burkholderia anthina TaxID=179879 RepID=UPI000F5F4CBF|nr:YadA family autotransporter adhesin [Burkholderia anthina]RQX83628.1 adhesin [Burkholderia anthina]